MDAVQMLEQSLCMWEDWSYLKGLNREATLRITGRSLFPLSGPILSYQELRGYLRNGTTDFAKVIRDCIGEEDVACEFGVLNPLPIELYEWVRQGKRIVSLSSQLILNGLTADFGEARKLREFVPRATSFAVILDQPLQEQIGNTYPCLLYTIISNTILHTDQKEKLGTTIILRIFPSQLQKYTPVSSAERSHFNQYRRKRHWDELKKQAKTRLVQIANIPDKLIMFNHNSKIDGRHICLTSVPNQETNAISANDVVRAATHIVVYTIQAMAQQNREIQWTPVSMPRKNGIGNGALICRIN